MNGGSVQDMAMDNKMTIRVLGTGTSQGVPVVACGCQVCKSHDERDKRLRTSVMISKGDTNVVIDAGPDFRQQMLHNQVKKLDAVLITHSHKDHTGGLDDVRAYNWFQKQAMHIYSSKQVLQDLQQQYPYAFGSDKYPGAPDMKLHILDSTDFSVNDLTFIPIHAMHNQMPVLGFRTGGFSYLTDANQIAAEELEKMKDSEVVIINGLRKEKHHSHFNLQEAIDILAFLSPRAGYITHISHQMGLHAEVSKLLPDNIFLATDNLQITLDREKS
jgi:phosphoribosyl 1,2-cyclic phosphate phosphodiesterase